MGKWPKRKGLLRIYMYGQEFLISRCLVGGFSYKVLELNLTAARGKQQLPLNIQDLQVLVPGPLAYLGTQPRCTSRDVVSNRGAAEVDRRLVSIRAHHYVHSQE